MSCILRASGADFPVDDFLRDSVWSPCKIYHRGQPKFAARPNGSRSERCGFNLDVSEADFDDLPQQIADALKFLQQHGAEVQRIVNFRGVESVGLDFAVEQGDEFVRRHQFPAKLLLMCGQLGLKITVSSYGDTAEI